MNLRTASRLVVVTLVAVLGVGLYVVRATGAAPAPALRGTDLAVSGRYLAAPDFSLADQDGKTVTLHQMRGHTVVLTFLAARCPGECPPTAQRLGAALRQAGTAGGDATVVAVSTDPAGDTPETVRSFLRAQLGGDAGLIARWHYLTGTQAQLAPVWSAYHVATGPGDGSAGPAALGLYLIDKQGRERVYLDGGFAPADAAADLRALGAG